MAKEKPTVARAPEPDLAGPYLASGHTIEDAQACLADFEKQGRKDKAAHYEKLIAQIKARS